MGGKQPFKTRLIPDLRALWSVFPFAFRFLLIQQVQDILDRADVLERFVRDGDGELLLD